MDATKIERFQELQRKLEDRLPFKSRPVNCRMHGEMIEDANAEDVVQNGCDGDPGDGFYAFFDEQVSEFLLLAVEISSEDMTAVSMQWKDALDDCRAYFEAVAKFNQAVRHHGPDLSSEELANRDSLPELQAKAREACGL